MRGYQQLHASDQASATQNDHVSTTQALHRLGAHVKHVLLWTAKLALQIGKALPHKRACTAANLAFCQAVLTSQLNLQP